MTPRAGDDPYEGCAVYAEHGACVCSTGIVGNCQADREPQPTDGPDFHAEHAAWRTRNGRVTGRAGDDGVRDDLIGSRIEWQGQSWFVALAQHDTEDGDDVGHWHLTLTAPQPSRIKTPERLRRQRQTTGSGITWLPADQVPGAVLSPQAQRDLDEKLRAIDQAQARARVESASYVIY